MRPCIPLILLLTACAAPPLEHRTKRDACPPVALDTQLQTLTHYDSAANPFQARAVSTARLTRFQNACTIDARALIVDMRLTVEGYRLTPLAQADTEPFPYILAITDDRGRVLAERYYAASLTFPPGGAQASLPQTLREAIPLNGAAPENLRIALGFAVSAQKAAAP